MIKNIIWRYLSKGTKSDGKVSFPVLKTKKRFPYEKLCKYTKKLCRTKAFSCQSTSMSLFRQTLNSGNLPYDGILRCISLEEQEWRFVYQYAIHTTPVLLFSVLPPYYPSFLPKSWISSAKTRISGLLSYTSFFWEPRTYTCLPFFKKSFRPTW